MGEIRLEKNVALVAHVNENDIVEWAKFNKALAAHSLYATGEPARRKSWKAGLNITVAGRLSWRGHGTWRPHS
jgi:methylglyoxal synthase